MVAGHVALFFLAVFEQREFRHPQEVEGVLGDQAQLVAQVHAQVAQGGVDHGGLAGLEEDDVAHLEVQGLTDAGAFFFGQELGDGRLPLVFLDLDPGQAHGAVDLDELGVGVDLLAGHGFAAGHLHGLDQLGLGKELEAGTAHDVGDVHQLQTEAGIGLVHTVAAHGFFILHAREGTGDVHAHDVVEHAGHEVFGHGHDLFLVHEAHLDIHLGEFGLAVGTQVFVTEAAHDLEVAVETAHHEQLLEQLGRLRQGVELAGVETAGHQEVAGAFGRGLGEHRGLHFQEAVVVQLAADGLGHLVAQAQVGLHARTAQVQITPGQAQVLTGVAAFFDGEGRGLGGVEQLPLMHHHFDGAGDQVGVSHALGTGTHHARDGQHVFGTQDVRVLVRGGSDIGAENDLGQAFTVTQVHEDEAAVVAAVLHPAHEADRLSIVVQGQLAASVAAGPVAEVFDELLVLLLHVQALRLFSHYFFPLSELAARKSAAASRDRVCCSPLSMSLTTTAPAAASSGPMMQQKRALDLPA